MVSVISYYVSLQSHYYLLLHLSIITGYYVIITYITYPLFLNFTNSLSPIITSLLHLYYVIIILLLQMAEMSSIVFIITYYYI